MTGDQRGRPTDYRLYARLVSNMTPKSLNEFDLCSE